MHAMAILDRSSLSEYDDSLMHLHLHLRPSLTVECYLCYQEVEALIGVAAQDEPQSRTSPLGA